MENFIANTKDTFNLIFMMYAGTGAMAALFIQLMPYDSYSFRWSYRIPPFSLACEIVIYGQFILTIIGVLFYWDIF